MQFNLRNGFAALALAIGLAACGDDAATNAKTTATNVAKAGKDWTAVVAATPDGGFRMGNPAARVKLVEYASLTCPHCKDFHEEALGKIKADYVATGNVSYEFRNFVLNGPDYAASLLARCQGAAPFFNLINAFFETQTQWIEPFSKLGEADQKRLGALPADRQIAGLAVAGGLDGFMRQRGMTRAKFDQCLADKAAVDRLAKMRSVATDELKLGGTPSFLINGKVVEGALRWEQLEPELRRAVAG